MRIAPGVWRVGCPENDYVIVSNEFARSKLSPRAKAVGLYLLTHEAGYVVTQRRISSELGMSESAVAGALGDLEKANYLRRRVVYAQGGGVAGTAYLISDFPMESMTLDSMTMESMTMESRVHKKTNSNQKTKKNKKTTPPGGAPRSGSPDGLSLDDPTPAIPKEEPMPRRTPEPQLGLFEAELPAAPPRPPGPGSVVAAYVEAFRAHFSAKPTGSATGRVGRLAKQLLDKGVDVDLLVQAGAALGATPYTALEVQLNKMRRPQSTTARGMVPAVDRDADIWQTMAEESAQRDAEAAKDPAWQEYLARVEAESVAS